jgi:hypothetical protein
MNKETFLPASNIRKVSFNSTVKVKKVENLSQYDESPEDVLTDNYNDSDNENDNDIIEDDPTDIKDDDEIDILKTDEINISNINEEDIYLTNLMNKFLDRYPHLDNFKNKEIIYKLCYMLVKQLPSHKDNQIFYINLLENLIKDINNPNLNDLMN